MKKSISILYVIIIGLFATTGCNKQYYTIDKLSGVYTGKSIPSYNSIIWSGREEILGNREEIMAFLSGDSSKYSFSYNVYNELPPITLELHADNTFDLVVIEFKRWKGQWSIIGKDSLMLSFNSYPKDTTYYHIMEIAYPIFQYEGTRKLKIINKNKLQFDYHPFNAPMDSTIKVLFKRK